MSLLPGVTRIAVLHANALGDFLFTLPALESLRAAYPGAELVLLGAPWHREALEGRPGPIDRVMVVPALPGLREPVQDEPAPAPELPGFARRARAEGFDLAVQLHGGGRHSNPVVAALGARLTAGQRAADAPPLDRTVPYIYYQPEVFRHLETVGLVGAGPVTYRPCFALDPADHGEAASVAKAAPDAKRAALHPGASDTRRRWPARHFAAVGDALALAGAEVVVTGTPPERHLVEEVCAAMDAVARPLVGVLSIRGLAALLAGCVVVVANDTGPLHLAAAVGTPTVGLFWIGNMINGARVDRARHRPIISWTVHCPRCGVDCTRDIYPHRGGPPPCSHRDTFVADIPVAEVVDEALDLIR
jgi:ADP-heptose:LPS heptosyltransferase